MTIWQNIPNIIPFGGTFVNMPLLANRMYDILIKNLASAGAAPNLTLLTSHDGTNYENTAGFYLFEQTYVFPANPSSSDTHIDTVSGAGIGVFNAGGGVTSGLIHVLIDTSSSMLFNEIIANGGFGTNNYVRIRGSGYRKSLATVLGLQLNNGGAAGTISGTAIVQDREFIQESGPR